MNDNGPSNEELLEKLIEIEFEISESSNPHGYLMYWINRRTLEYIIDHDNS